MLEGSLWAQKGSAWPFDYRHPQLSITLNIYSGKTDERLVSTSLTIFSIWRSMLNLTAQQQHNHLRVNIETATNLTNEKLKPVI